MTYDPVTRTNRIRYFVSRIGGRWHFRVEGRRTLATFSLKDDAVAFARAYLKAAWRNHGQRSELTIRTLWGIFRQKETYGEDPPETKG